MNWWRWVTAQPRIAACWRNTAVRLFDQMIAIVAGATLISYMIYTASAEVEAKLGTRYLYLTVPFVAFGILRYLYLVDARALLQAPHAAGVHRLPGVVGPPLPTAGVAPHLRQLRDP